MKFRPRIGSADYQVKARKVRQFLEQGDRVKITVMFRGREVAHPELGRVIVDRLVVDVGDIANADYPRMSGRDMVMILTPRGRREGGPGVREPRRPRGPTPSPLAGVVAPRGGH